MNPSLVPNPVSIVPAPDLIRRYTYLGGTQRRHLESLMAFWSLLADLSFSDLLLFTPVTRDLGGDDETALELGPNEPPVVDRIGAFVVLGQIRPTTSQTLYEVDLVGQVQPAESLPNVVEAYRSKVIIRSEQPRGVSGRPGTCHEHPGRPPRTGARRALPRLVTAHHPSPGDAGKGLSGPVRAAVCHGH